MLSGAPYGYRYIRKTDEAPASYLVIDVEAQVVQRVYEMYTVEGLSMGEIARRLDADGIPTRKQSARWERSVVWAMLRNPAYRGAAAFGKTRVAGRIRVTRALRRRAGIISSNSIGHERPREESIEIPVPALVSEESFARAQELLLENKIRSRRRTITPSVVQGLVSCQKCGYAFSRTSTHTTARKLHYYKCIGSDSWRRLGGPVCDNRMVRQDLLDQIVWAEVIRLLEDPMLIQQELDRRLTAARSSDLTTKREQSLQRESIHVGKASNDFSLPIKRNSCRSSSCGNACLRCGNANRLCAPSCRRSLTKPPIAPRSCALQKPSRRSSAGCVAPPTRLTPSSATNRASRRQGHPHWRGQYHHPALYPRWSGASAG